MNEPGNNGLGGRVEVGGHRLDPLVEGCPVVELKAVKAIEDVFFAIGRSCLKAVQMGDGLRLNFEDVRTL